MGFASSAAASTTIMSCWCNAGYYEVYDSVNPVCEQCGAGTYKEAASDHENDVLACDTCPAYSNSLPASGSVTSCLCNAGYTGTLLTRESACAACFIGFFKASNGTGECVPCAKDYYSDTLASTECKSCVEYLDSDGGITQGTGSNSPDACECDLNLGYTEVEQGGGRTCSACQAGTFATEEGCQNCTGGQFADVAGLTACKDCPANSSSYDYPHVACQCHAGYYCAPDGNNQSESCPSGNCIACSIDTFKDYTGGASACDVCQNNSVSDLASVSQDDCKCDLGYRQDGPDTCVACLAGHYADTLDSATCTPCGDRFYTAQSDFPWTSIAECTRCEVCNTATDPAYEDHFDAANDGAGCGLDEAEDCQPCPADTSLFEYSTADNWNAGQESCVCDANMRRFVFWYETKLGKFWSSSS